MKIIATYPTNTSGLPLSATFENCTVERNPEFPNWVDVIEITHKPALPRDVAKIVAMLPAGTLIEIVREASDGNTWAKAFGECQPL